MAYKPAECLIFIPLNKVGAEDRRQSRNTPQSSDCILGYVLMPAAFVHQRPKVPHVFEKSCLRVVRNEDVHRLPASHHKLDVVEIFLNESPEASLDPLSVISDHPDARYISLLIYSTIVTCRKTRLHTAFNPGDVRPAVDETNHKAFERLITRNFQCAQTYSGGILHLASARGQEVLMRTVLDNGVEVNSKTDGGPTALHLAAHAGFVSSAKFLLDRGAHVDEVHGRGFTSLHIACQNRPKEIVQLLLDRGADVNATTADRSTPLHIACQESPKETVQLLLVRGADVNAMTAECRTPLHIACQNDLKDLVQLLLDKGTDVNAMTAKHLTPLHIACQNGLKDLVELLLDRDADVNATTADRSTPLHYACSKSPKEIVQLLLDRGADVNATDYCSSTPLHKACRGSPKEMVQLLLDRGADVNATTTGYCSTPLHYACSDSPKEIVQLLLDRGADVNATDAYHSTPLHIACQESPKETVQLLLERGADVNATDALLSTPLHKACRGSPKEIVQLLLDRGADVNAMTYERRTLGRTPLYFAANRSMPDVAVLVILLENGARFDETYEKCQGETILQLASMGVGDCIDHIKFLLEYSCNNPKQFSLQLRKILGDIKNFNKNLPRAYHSVKYSRKESVAIHVLKMMALHNLEKLEKDLEKDLDLTDLRFSYNFSAIQFREECELEVAF